MESLHLPYDLPLLYLVIKAEVAWRLAVLISRINNLQGFETPVIFVLDPGGRSSGRFIPVIPPVPGLFRLYQLADASTG